MLMRAIAVDSKAVQRHRATILECVKDSDPSIRKRALDLVYLLVNETNVKPLTKELTEHLEVSDPEFKGDLTAKICSIVEKFSPEKIWYIDQMLKVLSELLYCVDLGKVKTIWEQFLASCNDFVPCPFIFPEPSPDSIVYSDH
ncbi:hypothetical protein H5410_021217 [Solanum commersonii]|uniref:Clathrin/coatomer adaptor adaptin-like N-terminal domain-containing protein n=1 Tax=Solanum commersonii TaxID=4109 RepID=A0A9J5ZDL7_SOLCO|nr:hypothetical protein H5410_021217 [Solanum commersonii]